MERLDVDICVIGAGSGGLSVAAGAAQLGAGTVLIERHKMGGDCLNFGCVPSKSLLAAAHAAQTARRAASFGVACGTPSVDGSRVHDHVHSVIGAIAPNDSVERFTGLGVKVVRASARFVDAREVEAGDVRVRARRFVIAAGSSPAVPPIPGLDRVPFETNETIFDRTSLPGHLVVIGGGPIGIEMAQAHRRLGSEVTVLDRGRILPRDDPESVAILRRLLTGEGIRIREDARIAGVERTPAGVAVLLDGAAGPGGREGPHPPGAAGGRPHLPGPGVGAAGGRRSPPGNAGGAPRRAPHRRGVSTGGRARAHQFTHMATYHAGIVIRNALFRLPAKVDHRAVPWVTYTEPELAHVGMGEQAARDAGAPFRVLRWPFHDNDRAQAERATHGLVKVVATPRGRVLGATILGPSAGELIQTWVLAIAQKIKVGAVANMIAPYPTLGEVNKRAAGSFFTPALFSPRTRRIVRFLSRFG